MSIRLTVPDTAEIREQFTFEDDEFGSFTDAIYWKPVDYLASTLTQRDEAKRARFESWRAQMRDVRDNPPALEEEPVADEPAV